MYCLEPILNVGLQSNRIVARLVSEFSETNRLTLTSALVLLTQLFFGKWFQKFLKPFKIGNGFKNFRNQLWLNISHLFFSFLHNVKKVVSKISGASLNNNTFDMLEATCKWMNRAKPIKYKNDLNETEPFSRGLKFVQIAGFRLK